MILRVVSTQTPALGFASHNPVYVPQAPWYALRSSILEASVGIPADLTQVLDKIDPTGPGEGFPLTHRQAYEAVGFRASSVALQAAHLAIGAVKDAPTQTALVAAYTAVDTNETVGYAVHIVDMQTLACQREYVMFKVTGTWDNLMPHLGVQTMTMTAAYVGRLFWALEGFDFENDATRTMMRERFARFMEHFDLAAADLFFRRDDGTVEPFALDRLDHSWDFAHVVSKKGPLRLPTRTSDYQDDEGVLEAGRAFMLGDFRRPELADCVCPDYSAVRQTDLDSPNQRQARAYGAARAAKAKSTG